MESLSILGVGKLIVRYDWRRLGFEMFDGALRILGKAVPKPPHKFQAPPPEAHPGNSRRQKS